MMSTYVGPNQTYHLQGTFAAGGRLVAQYGRYAQYHGARIMVTSSATNDGQIIVEGALADQAYYPHNNATLQNAGVLTNNGNIIVNGASSYGGPVAGVGGILNNDGVLLNSGDILLGGSAGYGSFASSVAGRLEDNGKLVNSGTIEIEAFAAGYYDFHGTSPGVLDVNGVLTNAALIEVDGRGGYGGAGATLNIAGSLTNRAGGLITGTERGGEQINVLAGGVLNNAGTLSATYGQLYDGAMTLAIAGVLNTDGLVALHGGQSYFYSVGALLNLTGQLNNSGSITICGGDAPRPTDSAAGATLVDAGRLVNTGVIDIQDGISGGTGLLIDSGRLVNAGTITIGASNPAFGAQGLTISATGSLTDFGLINGAGTLVNDGVLTSGNAAHGAISVATLVNDGTIDAAGHSSLSISSTVAASGGGSGTFDIGAFATLRFAGAIGPDQTIDFSGSGGTLALTAASSVAAVLNLDQPRATIDFLGRDVTSATASGTTLMIGFAQGGTLDFHLAAPLAPGTSIDLANDGRGGTDVLFQDDGTALARTAGFSSSSATQSLFHQL